MLVVMRVFFPAVVAPLAGAWIEMFCTPRAPRRIGGVAPLAGAWIEISWDGLDKTAVFRRPPRGGVD